MEFDDELDALVGNPFQLSEDVLEECRAKDQFGSLVFELYKETSRLVCVSSGAYFGRYGDAMRLGRNQAICAGLLVRISKYMLSVVKLSAEVEHGESVQALNRCIIESAVNLRYLLLKNDENVYDRFVKNSLVAEKELYDFIWENIESKAGETFLVEQSMLKSILDVCEQSGVTPEEIDTKAGSWGGSIRDRLLAIGYSWPAYTALERIPSHAIHGDWVDIYKNHLLRAQDGYELNYEYLKTDGELLSPVSIFVVDATLEYLDSYFDKDMIEPLCQRLLSVQERLGIVESARHDWETVDN